MDDNRRVALVTGASRGIGRAIALRLALDGMRIGVNYLSNTEAAHGVASAIQDLDSEALLLQGDVSDPEAVTRIFEDLLARWGRIDVLVNNAGTTRDTLMMRMNIDDWDGVIKTNLRSAFLCSRTALRPMLRQRWGRIINISSVSGTRGNAGQANYAASKAALIGLTKAVAREAASRTVTVNAIAPGLIATDIVESMPENARQELINQIPLGRLGTADEVAELAGFLASDAASYITGQVLVIDGGLAM